MNITEKKKELKRKQEARMTKVIRAYFHLFLFLYDASENLAHRQLPSLQRPESLMRSHQGYS